MPPRKHNHDIDGPASADQRLADAVHTAATFLFVPGDRPERFEKAAAAGADLVVLDLEDAVAAGDKETARRNVARWIAEGNDAVVRVNAPGSGLLRSDLAALHDLRCAIMVPKAEDPEQLRRIGDARGLAPLMIALIETARGVLSAPQIATLPGIRRLALGSFDLAAELGIDPTDQQALAATRGNLVLAAAAAGLAGPIDGVTAAVDDAARLTAETHQARRLGFAGKLCIHPRQVAVVADAFAPGADEIAWARKIVDAFATAGAVAAVDGEMVDKPVLDRAERILARAE
ncbi:HpcH/HpaI aldolase/citrate lyase family protein [Gordonia sp. (in: high G+C Gram-positive bacteria)]|uniref:HpcH/HpaI aldolase/citrate lyase family protein n=1 Tax=Gordonia sp. (in: high G+C Gram-positive bacteria) TaxID=84139 RepID=UPI0039E26FDD